MKTSLGWMTRRSVPCRVSPGRGKAGHTGTILVDASAVTSVTKGFAFFRRLIGSDSPALACTSLPERERQSLAEQMGGPPGSGPTHLWRVFCFSQETEREIYGNRTMMLLYQIYPVRVASSVTPIPLASTVDVFASADRTIEY